MSGAPLVRTDTPGVYQRGDVYLAIWRDADGKQRSMTLPTLEAATHAHDRERRRRGRGSLQESTDKTGTVTWYARFYVDGKQQRHRIGVKRLPNGTVVITEDEAEERLRQLMLATRPAEREFGNLAAALVEMQASSPAEVQAAVETALRRVHWVESELRKQTMEKEST